MMLKTNKPEKEESVDIARIEPTRFKGSSFRLIVLASQRNKQLVRGAHRRIDPDPRRSRNTSVAIEEVRRGLVAFTTIGAVVDPAQLSPNDHAAVLD